jgi:hypothetical protein
MPITPPTGMMARTGKITLIHIQALWHFLPLHPITSILPNFHFFVGKSQNVIEIIVINETRIFTKET